MIPDSLLCLGNRALLVSLEGGLFVAFQKEIVRLLFERVPFD